MVRDPNVTMKMRMFELRISNKQLAKSVGVSPATISLVMNGRTEPTLLTAQKIARELGMSTDELFPLPKEDGK